MSQTAVSKHFSVRKRNIHNVDGIKSVKTKGEKQTELGQAKQNAKADLQTIAKIQQKSDREKASKGKQSTLVKFFTPQPVKNKKVIQRQKGLKQSVSITNLKSVVDAEVQSSLTRSPKRTLASPTEEDTPSKKKHLDTNLSASDATTKTTTKTARRKLILDTVSNDSEPLAKLASEVSHEIGVTKLAEETDSGVTASETDVLSKSIAEAVLTKVGDASPIEKPKETVRRKLQLGQFASESKASIPSPNVKIVFASPQKNLLHVQRNLSSRQKEQKSDKLSEVSLKLDRFKTPTKKSITEARFSSPAYVSPKKNLLRTPDKLDALIDSSRSTLLLSPKLDELKKKLRQFSEATSTPKSPYKSNSAVSSPKSIKKISTPTSKNAAQSDSLVLPSKYKVLAEMFRSMDAVVATLNNRKERITFDKVKEGIQKIMKKNFTEKHLGQIVKVYPSAYNLKREKVRCIAKKNSSSDYALVISPNLDETEGENKKSAFLPMNPSCLANRIIEFNDNLLNIVKEHHQDFLKKIDFVEVSDSDIQQWHPKFSVDSVPDVLVAELPQLPESKIHTAKDVLNNIQLKIGSIHKVAKALQSVTVDIEKTGVTLELKEAISPIPPKKEIKGISCDLLERIRMKEKEKLSKTMMQSEAEKKKLAMEEQIPKIMKIVYHYFIAENKATLPVEAVVKKIIHSFNSLSTSNSIKENLDLVAEKFPDWLQYVQIRTRLFVKLNKKTNIYEMLEKAGIK